MSMGAVLRSNKYRVTEAANVSDALHRIDREPFDVLLCDLHMPGAGDGYTVVSAMRHKNPAAITLVFTGFPALEEAMNAILLQADEVLVKPMEPTALLALIRGKLQNRRVRAATNTERVASILERDAEATISHWLSRVENDDELTVVTLTKEQRTGHLPKLFQELVHRLRVPRSLGTKQPSAAAVLHGKVRQTQGYTFPMIVEESRILQVSIFHTLQNNLATVDFSLLLIDVMTIADEVDSQLKQTLISFAEHET
jgi:DNA-binding response OmpR family regulator